MNNASAALSPGEQHRPVPALDVADRMIKWSLETGVPITPLQIQKLTYFAHGWHLGFVGTPLFADTVEAWEYGPVIPAVYHAFKAYGRRPITARLYPDGKYVLSASAETVVKMTWQAFSRFDGIRLSKITHAANGPWAQITQGSPAGQAIPDTIIESYYKDLINRADK